MHWRFVRVPQGASWEPLALRHAQQALSRSQIAATFTERTIPRALKIVGHLRHGWASSPERAPEYGWRH